MDKIIIWENTEDSNRQRYKICDYNDKIIFVGTGENVGISKALNYGLQYALDNAYDYLLTMDQDSVFYNFRKYKDAVIEKNDKNGKCICGPVIVKEMDDHDKHEFERREWCITSGMLVSTVLLKNIGGYNEVFSVDCVDVELCLRARGKGYNSFCCSMGTLLQRFGEFKQYHFLNKNHSLICYNASRTYNIIKGHLILYRIYRLPVLRQETMRYVRNTIKSIVFIKEQRIEKSKALVVGLFEGMFYSKES